jgi:hypothetical protein
MNKLSRRAVVGGGDPARMLERLCAVGGDRFEYELRLLLYAARAGLRVEEVPIARLRATVRGARVGGARRNRR